MQGILESPPPPYHRLFLNAVAGLFCLSLGGLATLGLVLAVGNLFTPSSDSGPLALGAATCLVLAAIFLWVTWEFRTSALPFRRIVELETRSNYYQWRSWQTKRVQLSKATKILGEVREHDTRELWFWTIEAVFAKYKEPVLFCTSKRAYHCSAEAKEDCRSLLATLSGKLDLPAKLLTHRDRK